MVTMVSTQYLSVHIYQKVGFYQQKKVFIEKNKILFSY